MNSDGRRFNARATATRSGPNFIVDISFPYRRHGKIVIASAARRLNYPTLANYPSKNYLIALSAGVYCTAVARVLHSLRVENRKQRREGETREIELPYSDARYY